jgi:hypothetical protein
MRRWLSFRIVGSWIRCSLGGMGWGSGEGGGGTRRGRRGNKEARKGSIVGMVSDVYRHNRTI